MKASEVTTTNQDTHQYPFNTQSKRTADIQWHCGLCCLVSILYSCTFCSVRVYDQNMCLYVVFYMCYFHMNYDLVIQETHCTHSMHMKHYIQTVHLTENETVAIKISETYSSNSRATCHCKPVNFLLSLYAQKEINWYHVQTKLS